MGEQAKPSRKIENSHRVSGWASEIIKRLLWVVIRRYDGSFSRRCSLDTKLLVCINASIRESLRRSKWEVDSIVAQSTEAWLSDQPVYLRWYCRIRKICKSVYRSRVFSLFSQHHWFSGKISACHAGASGSIRYPAPVSHDNPEWCNLFCNANQNYTYSTFQNGDYFLAWLDSSWPRKEKVCKIVYLDQRIF